jgi:hypothetical protein
MNALAPDDFIAQAFVVVVPTSGLVAQGGVVTLKDVHCSVRGSEGLARLRAF